jgi:dTDP-glucose 4,6-dehydratase
MNVRDWLHVEDHCRGIEACLVSGKVGEAYNIGGGEELPNIAVIDRICAEVDRAFAELDGLTERYPDAPAVPGRSTAEFKTFVTDRAGHDRRYAIDDRKAKAKMGYVPQHDFESGPAGTLRWYLANEDWWRSMGED